MTILVSFAGVDQNKPTSLYFVSDSRISWNRETYWDHAQKVFATINTSEIFAYCGDVLFPTQTLGQLITLADIGVLFNLKMKPYQRFSIYYDAIKIAFESYPAAAINSSFSIIYGVVYSKQFYCCQIDYSHNTKKFSTNQIKIPNKSDVMSVLGSGKNEFRSIYEKEKNGEWCNTSRGVFSAFCNMITKTKLKSVGGVPQIVSLFPNGKTSIYGVSLEGKNGIIGQSNCPASNLRKIEWRNENFERWDPEIKELISGAKRQPKRKL